jgi:hypothetical protein
MIFVAIAGWNALVSGAVPVDLGNIATGRTRIRRSGAENQVIAHPVRTFDIVE